MNALEYAIQMELDGEKYYREQAELNKDNSLYTVCLMLAEDEKKHAMILSNKLEKLAYELTDSEMLLDVKNVFTDINNIEMEEKEVLSQLDFYRIALDKEKQSIELYTDLLNKAADSEEKDVFEYLIRQERQHQDVLEELVTLLRHAHEWVEAAEFGIRKEY